MAIPGNEVPRTAAVSSRSRPSKSSPLAGPAVLSSSISLNDNGHDISNDDEASLSPLSSPSSPSSPSALLQLPTRPKSVHHPPSTLRSRSRSAQSLTRPVSWYNYPSEGGVGVVGANVEGNGGLNGTGMRITNTIDDVHLSPRPKSNVNARGHVNSHNRKRPSTAPGPSSSSSCSSEENDERLSMPFRATRLAVVAAPGDPQHAQLVSRGNPMPQGNSNHVRYSNTPSSIAFAASAAGSNITIRINGDNNSAAAAAAGNGGVRPTSILLDPDIPQPKPILKHRTSFAIPPSSSPTASSSRSSFLSSNSDEFGGVPRSRSRLSVVSNASASSSGVHLSPPPHHYHHLTYIKNIDAAETNKESWYTFSPYANTPKFSRLGLASAGVVMPVSKKEAVKVRERRLSAASSTSLNSKGKGLERTNTGASARSRRSLAIDRKSSDFSGKSFMREEEEIEAQQNQLSIQPPLPSSSPMSPTARLDVPLKPAHCSPAHSSTSSSARTGTSTSPTGSSQSSPASSVASLHVDGDTVYRSICGKTNKDGTTEDASLRNCEEKNRREGEDIEDLAMANGFATAPMPTKEPKEKRKSLSIGSLKSWKSPRSTSRQDLPDMPTLPVAATSSQGRGRGEEDLNDGQSITPQDAAGAALLEVESGSLLPQREPPKIEQLSPPLSDSMERAAPSIPIPNLKKRKSASALLARVKSWRWKREEPVGCGVGAKEEREARDGGGVENTASWEEKCAAKDVEERPGEDAAQTVEVNIADTDMPSTDITSGEGEGVSDSHGVSVDGGEATLGVTEEMDMGVEGLKEVLDEDDNEGSADSPYPGSTPSTTHSIPSFVPMSLMIPSPNLHVEDGQVPVFIEGKLKADIDEDVLERSVLIEIVPCTPIDDDDDDERQDVEQVQEQHEPKTVQCVTVTVTPTTSNFSLEEQAPIDQVVDLPLRVNNDPHTVYDILSDPVQHIVESPSQSPSPTPIPLVVQDDLAPAPTKIMMIPVPCQPSTHMNPSIHTGRGIVGGRSKSRGRNSSVRRMWNAVICGGADAEEIAVAEAWAELQAERGRPLEMYDSKKDEEAKVETVEIVVVDVGLDIERHCLNRPSFSEIGKAL